MELSAIASTVACLSCFQLIYSKTTFFLIVDNFSAHLCHRYLGIFSYGKYPLFTGLANSTTVKA